MNDTIRIRSWVAGTADEVRTGLLGYLSVTVGNLVLDGLTLRRTAAGTFAISFPARTDRHGNRHPYVRPIDDDARRQIEHELLRQIAQSSGGEA